MALVALALVCACDSTAPTEPLPTPGERGVRVVLVTLDTLRFDAVWPEKGKGPSSMPRLAERAAKGGARFDAFFSSSARTQPSHASMLTGVQPWKHGVVRNGLILGDANRTVAERLAEAGFETAAAVASFPVSRRFGFAAGYDRFLDDFELGESRREWQGQELGDQRFYSLAPDVTDRALELLSEMKSERQHLWVHYFDPHAPYGDAAPDEGVIRLPSFFRRLRRGETVSIAEVGQAAAHYRRDVERLDRELDRLLAALDAGRDRYETHVVIATDHGESFGEDGSLGHGYRLRPEQIRVPLLLFSAGVEPGVRTDSAGSADVAPTLLSLAGVPVEGSDELDGRDLTKPAASARVVGLRDYHPEVDEELRLDGPVRVEGPLVYTQRGGGAMFVGNGEGVQARHPIAEVTVAETDPEAEALLADLAKGLVDLGSDAAHELDAETVEGLRALGYTEPEADSGH